MEISPVGLLLWAVLGAVAGILIGRFVRGSGRGVVVDAVLGALGANVAALVLAFLRFGVTVDALIAIGAAIVGAGLFVLVLGSLLRRRQTPAEDTAQTVSSPT
jgi:uncharacterized membrane protein YeaQ/YmgE (transglycosylase-associated protein family)